MSKCPYCHQRKGKRACPALNGLICSQCCGSHRLSSIACPDDCVFLDSNLDYQQKRVGERFEQDRRTFYQELLELGGERATEIFYVFEALTFRFFQSRRDAQDGEAIAGIECLRRSFSPIHVPEPAPPAFGEELKKEFKVFGERQTLDSTLATAVLDAFAAAPDSRLFGIRRDGQVDCAAFVYDAVYEPHGLTLILFLIRMVRVVGWRMTRTMAQVLSEKPEREERRLELMILGTRARCQKLGLGRSMMHHVYAFARGRGYQSVVLQVAKETPAFGFYLREGFLVEKELALPTMPLCLLRCPLDERGVEGDASYGER